MAVDINNVVWRVVDTAEFDAAPFSIPHRTTYAVGDLGVQYELGTLPRELPTKRGAILLPSKEWLDQHDPDDENLGWDVDAYERDTFFVYDGGDWLSVNSEDNNDYHQDDVAQEVLDNGGTIVFDGIPDSITANTDK